MDIFQVSAKTNVPKAKTEKIESDAINSITFPFTSKLSGRTINDFQVCRENKLITVFVLNYNQGNSYGSGKSIAIEVVGDC
ncbi:hypothetical protein [Culicoidibacter larvae]|uniref:Uncharacterized protein n=1 Tax=Culicoidibacter larvae TaxID=2579976 RepID=A0A5R8Q6N4_9FIRM|nr:hypothetical protein [Culicoidibacter larvae]TLG70286.1 hypothetical protein FEZ08_11915 [Culicoidibacter larvae]